MLNQLLIFFLTNQNDAPVIEYDVTEQIITLGLFYSLFLKNIPRYFKFWEDK